MATAWNKFQKAHAGKGMSQKQMAAAFKGGGAATVVWNHQSLLAEIEMGINKRMMLAGEHLANAHKKNLSKPVRKLTKTRRRTTSRGAAGSTYTYADPASRSRPGEYPRADSTNLMKNIFWDVVEMPGLQQLKVGTPTKYGAELELNAGRLGLRATLLAELPVLRSIFVMRGMESPAFIFTGGG